MDIKWKNRCRFGIWVILFTFGLSGVLSLFTSGTRYIHRDYFHTPEFQSELDQFAGDLSMFELNSLTVTDAKKAITVTSDDINIYRKQNDINLQIANLKEQYDNLIQQADSKEETNLYKAERDKKIKDITNNFSNDDYIRNEVKQEKEQKVDDFFKERENYRSDYQKYNQAFRYYFKNSTTGKVYTNLADGDTAKLNPNEMLYVTKYTIYPDNSIYYSVPGYEDLMNSIIPKTTGTFEGQIAVPKSLSTANSIMMEYNGYQNQQIILLVFVLFSLSALLFTYYMWKKSKVIPAEMEDWRPYYNRLPIDVRIVFFILSIIGFLLFLFTTSDQIVYLNDNPLVFVKEIILCLAFGSLFCAATLLQWKYFNSIKKDIKNQWKKALLTKIISNLKDIFSNQTMGRQMIMVLVTSYFLGLASVLILVKPVFLPFYMILILAVGIPLLVIMTKRLSYLNKIVEKTNELAAGKMGQDLQVSGKTALATLAVNINALKQGVRTSQNAQAKSERLKTELITNVSHDLRTPLTSIITYTQLLKTDEVSNEDRSAYLEIIDRKSKRLKVLIDDLFEVSKMASGNMELTKEKVDLGQLLQQALAEYDEIIIGSNLNFRVASTEKPVYAYVDGQKLWRVFDNLIGNILKYSLENSRVYITVSKMNDEAIITFKNVSKYELSENSDELFERFKRGDTSRHTDGSGLGLAIAKSIVDLHGGSLDIETDGDLFKVSISLRIEE